MKRMKQKGSTLVLTTLALTVLLGIMGLGIDMGVLRYQKRLQQTAADAGALAGAGALAYGSVTTESKNATATNGFTDGTNNVTVTVNNPPASGPHTSDANYVEVLVSAVQPTYFMRIFGITSETVSARAVATNTSGASNSGCLYTLGSPDNSIEGININGNATLSATTCGIVDDGNFNTKGNALVVNAGTFGTSGDWAKSGPGGTVTCAESATCPVTNMPSAGDPFAYLTPPCSPCTGGTSWSGGGNIPAGTYSQITLTGGTLNMSGQYIITGPGGFSVSGNPTITGSNVFIYFANSATFNATGTPTVNLSPSSSGSYAGILMWQDAADTNTNGPSFGGNTGTSYNGVLYFPSDNLTFFGHNTTYSAGIVVAKALTLSGTPNVTLNGQASLPPGVHVFKNANLVE